MDRKAALHHTIAGQGPPLLAEGLSGSRRIITVDLPGHGLSEHSPGDCTFDACARDIIALLRCVSNGPVAAVGWSMGASILLKAVEMEPRLFESLVFISGNPSLVSRPDYPCGIPGIAVERLYRQRFALRSYDRHCPRT
jgi:pimeloyl-ACP methyl ester carboxylesterase